MAPLVGDRLETVLGTYLLVCLSTSAVVVVHLLSCSLFSEAGHCGTGT